VHSLNYYRLAELFSAVVRPALGDFLNKAMHEKPVAGYDHTAGWWKANHSRCLSRVPPTGIEKIKVTKDPSEWLMNLLLKVIKYSNHDLIPRYKKVWRALDVLIKTRREVLSYKETQTVSTDQMSEYFHTICNAIAEFELPNVENIYAEQEELKTKEYSEAGGEKLHKELLAEGNGWAVFEGKLYERGGMPTLPQLRAFSGKAKKINVIQQVAPKFSSIGTFLLSDDDGTIVSGLKISNGYDVTRTSEAIFKKWLEAEAGPSWTVLVKCLRDADLNALAKQIEECLI
jgi:hypothetical protein